MFNLILFGNISIPDSIKRLLVTFLLRDITYVRGVCNVERVIKVLTLSMPATLLA